MPTVTEPIADATGAMGRHAARPGRRAVLRIQVDNQAIVIPETIDAIRALAGTVRAANESIVRTNTALGIDSALM